MFRSEHFTINSRAAVLLACLCASVGCAPGTSSNADDRQARFAMNVLSVFYGDYMDEHQGTPPKDKEDFLTYLESRAGDLKGFDFEHPDQMLTSPRDGLPLVIICGKRLAPRDSPGTPWAAYEQMGVDGMRMAVRVRGGAHELTSEEVARLEQQLNR